MEITAPFHVLLIDDSPDDRADIRQMLLRGSSQRYKFTEAETGSAALRALREMANPPGCILLDFNLPDMNALEMLAEWHAGTPLLGCPVVVLTGMAECGQRVIGAGAQDFLGKSWASPESLTRAIENAVERYALTRERQRAYEALCRSEQRLDLGLRVADVALAEVDYTTGLHHLSAESAQQFGLGASAVALTREQVHATFHSDDRAELATRIAESLDPAGVGWFAMDHRVVWPSGEVRWLRVRQHVTFAGEGRARSPLRAMLATFDLTTEKRAEERLRLFEQAVTGIRDVVMITEAEPIDDPGPRIVYVNPAFTELTGYTAADVLGMTPRLLQGPRTDRAVLNRLRYNLEQGEAFSSETINYRKDGTELVMEWQISPLLNASSTITHFVAIQRDITGRKRLEAQLIQSQKLETVGTLAGGVAHEFNSILTTIMGQSDLLLADLPEGSPLINKVTEINQAAGRAAILTRQLLAYGRKQTLQPEVLNLNAVLESMAGTMRHLVGPNIDIRSVPAAGLRAVKADAGQISQVITNMVINAHDVMPAGGKLTLETANFSLDQSSAQRYPELKPGDYVMLAISDTGTGMSAGVQARLFEPFFSTKGIGEGTGLGLATCYGIIKQSGGHIAVCSEPGVGTTFKIYLPQVATITAQAPQRVAAPGMPRGTETILLVEDDPALREMAVALLQSLGYTVLIAANGIEALSLRDTHYPGHIDLLFTDLVMPQMSGKELAERIRILSPQTHILFNSGYTENAIVHQGLLNQGVAMLQKPFTPAALAQKLREVLDQPATAGPQTDSGTHESSMLS